MKKILIWTATICAAVIVALVFLLCLLGALLLMYARFDTIGVVITLLVVVIGFILFIVL